MNSESWCLTCGGETPSESIYFCSEACRVQEFGKSFSPSLVPSSPTAASENWEDSASVTSTFSSTSSKRSSVSLSPSFSATAFLAGSSPNDWFASRSPRQRTLTGSVAPEEPEPYPSELKLESPVIPASGYHVHHSTSTTGSPSWQNFDRNVNHSPENPDDDPWHSSPSSSSSDFPLALGTKAAGQQAAAASATANWIVEAIEPIVASLVRRELRFREPLRPEFRDVVATFEALLKEKREKLKSTAEKKQSSCSCWQRSCQMTMMGMMQGTMCTSRVAV